MRYSLLLNWITTSPSLRAKTGTLKPNSRIEKHMRSTAESFLRGFGPSCDVNADRKLAGRGARQQELSEVSLPKLLHAGFDGEDSQQRLKGVRQQ
jgi:hypothetical protein